MADVCELRSTLVALHDKVNTLRMASNYRAKYFSFPVSRLPQKEAVTLVRILACVDTLAYMATSHQIKQLTREGVSDIKAIKVLQLGLRDVTPRFSSLMEEMFGVHREEWHDRPNPTVRGSRFNFTHLASYLLYETLVGCNRNQKTWVGQFYYDLYRFVFRLYENGSRFADLIRPHHPTALNMDEMRSLEVFASGIVGNHPGEVQTAVDIVQTFEPVDILLMGRIAIDLSPKSDLLAVGSPVVEDHALVLTGYTQTRARKQWPVVGFAKTTGEPSYTVIAPIVERKENV